MKDSANLPFLRGATAFVVAFIASLNIFDTPTGAFLFSYDMSAIQRFMENIYTQEVPLDGERLKAVPYFPEMFLYGFARLFSSSPNQWSLAAFFFISALAQTIGWMLVCRQLGARKTIVALPLFIQAIHFLFLFLPHGNMFILPLTPLFHAGLWTLIPYLMFTAMNFHDLRMRIALFVLLFLSMGDPLIVPWFAAPCAVTFVILGYCRMLPLWDLARMLVLLAAACASGYIILGWLTLEIFSPTNINVFRTSWGNILVMFDNILWLSSKMPHLAVSHVLFSATITYFFVRKMQELITARAQAAKEQKEGKSPLPHPGFGAAFCTVFLPAAMAAAICTQMLLLSYPIAESQHRPGLIQAIEVRYAMPFFYIPLFFGWAVLIAVAPAGFFSMVFNKITMTLKRKAPHVAAVVIIIACLPNIVSLVGKDLSPYNQPFLSCVREHAKRLGWTGAIGADRFWKSAIIADDIPIVRELPVESNTPGIGILYVGWDVHNRHLYSGEFQVVALNKYKGRIFLTSPGDISHSCLIGRCGRIADHSTRVIQEQAALLAFGEPAERLECEGVGLWHYSPPLRFDFSQYDSRHDYPKLIRNGKIVP